MSSSISIIKSSIEEQNILASQFQMCINAGKYRLAGDLLIERNLPKKFIVDNCFIPLLNQDFEKKPTAKRFFIWLLKGYEHILIPRLFIAALKNVEAFSYLLDHSDEILKNTEVIKKCFRKIIKFGYIGSCKALINKLSEKNISIQQILITAKDKQLPIFLETIKRKTWDIFQEFVQAVPTLEPCFPDGNTLLHEIAMSGFIVPLYRVFAYKKKLAREKINVENDKKQTPLMYAIVGGNSDVVEFLIANGANFTKKRGGATPFEFAQANANDRITIILHNALFGDFEISQDITKDTPLGQKMMRRKEAGIKLCIEQYVMDETIEDITPIIKLIEEGWIDPNLVCDKDGNTLACFAATYNLVGLCELLVEKGADFFIANNEKKTPIRLAKELSCYEVLAFFTEQFPQEFTRKTAPKEETPSDKN